MNLALIFFLSLFLGTILVLCAHIVRQRNRIAQLKFQKGVLLEALKGYSESNRFLLARVRLQTSGIEYLLNEMGMNIPPDSEFQITPSEEY